MRAPSGYLTSNYIICKYTAEFHPGERTCRPCGFTVNISSRRHRHLINIVKRNTETEGMGPSNETLRTSDSSKSYYFTSDINLKIISTFRIVVLGKTGRIWQNICKTVDKQFKGYTCR